MHHERPNLPGHGQPVEDYTVPFLIVAGVLCWIVLVVIWAIWGILGATISAVAADRIMTRNA
jgi:hypothetical protein